MIKPELTPATNKQLWKLNDLSGKIFHHTTAVGVLEEKAGVEKSLLEGEAGFNVTLPLTKDQAANFINILIKKVDMLEEYSQLLKKEIEKTELAISQVMELQPKQNDLARRGQVAVTEQALTVRG